MQECDGELAGGKLNVLCKPFLHIASLSMHLLKNHLRKHCENRSYSHTTVIYSADLFFSQDILTVLCLAI